MARQIKFAWEGTDRAGREVSGRTAAPSARFARARLRRDGITVTRFRRRTKHSVALRRPVKAAEIALLSRQLATMMRAGVPMVQAFDILAGDVRDARVSKAISIIRGDLATGSALSTSLARFPDHFDALYRNLVDVGEQSGTLDAMVDRIATYQEKSAATKRKVKKALTYPALVVVAAVAVTAIMLIHVVPQFEAVFRSVGADLPLATRLVIQLSEVAQTGWWIGVLAVLALTAGWAALQKRSQAFRDAVDHVSLKVPVAGAILAKAASARFARTLSTAVAAGVPLVEALGAIAAATGNAAYVVAVQGMRDEVAAGRPLQAAMVERGVFPDMMVRMVAVGEESGRLDDMLARSAEEFEARVDEAVEQLTTLIEPLTMALLGVLVGGLIVAMYLPVFQLGSVFGG